jgi:flagellar hook-basal body complex protein FliE
MQVTGPEWQVDPTAPAAAQPAGAGAGFAGMLGKQVGALDGMQADAASASQALATGQAGDLNSAVMAVERARLAMQLAVQVRGKLVEAYQDVFHTQV